MNYKSYICILLFLFTGQAYSQSLSTNFDALEDYYRREQLLGNISLDHSFVSYPLFPSNAFDVNDPFDPTNKMDRVHGDNFDGVFKLDDNKYTFKLLPVYWKNQYNSHHPEGLNDGAMIPSQGYQTIVSAGVFFKYDHLSIKFQPEFVHASNAEYEGFPLTRDDPALADLRWAQYYGHTLNYIDQPELFGDGSYNKMLWGQSSIRLTLNTISLGLSNENLWWGPGMRNSLLMTNSASGFVHFTLNTVKPVNTYIGSFEGQIVTGWLKGSGYPPPNHESGHYVPKPDEGRYFNGMLLNYQPKWIPGLHLGLIRSFQTYHSKKGVTFEDYLPIFSPFSAENALPDEEKEETNNYENRDQYNSVFMRFAWPKSHVEIYGEYGRSSDYWDKRDRIVQLHYSGAFNFGFRKLIQLNNKHDDNIGVGMELTQLVKNANSTIRPSRSWGASGVVKHGSTHRGQLLGAGIGPGSNTQTLNIRWNRSLKSIGLQLERYVHNNDFHFEMVRDVRMHWVDLSAALLGSWDYKNLIFNVKLKAIGAKNYQWVYDNYNINDYWDTSDANDVFNFHGQLGVMYRF